MNAPLTVVVIAVVMMAGMLSASAQVAAPVPADPVAQLKQRGVVVVRAVAELPKAKLVEYVARNAQQMDLVVPGDKSLKGRTPRQIIEQACGSLQPGYATVFAEFNKPITLPLDDPIEVEPDKIVFPACLYARSLDAATPYRAMSGDTQTSLAERLIGYGRYDPRRLKTMFGAVNNFLLPNEPVRARFLTAPTFLTPTTSLAVFEGGIAAAGRATVDQPETGGSIIGPTDESCTGGEPVGGATPTFDQVRASYPFNPVATRAAYARSLGGDQPDKVYVAVLDNGFWGVPCAEGSCPDRDASGRLAFNEPFPRKFFATDLYQGDIGPTLSNRYAPVNYLNRLGLDAVTPVSAHGTHVAGLVFGGVPGFDTAWRSIFGTPGASWLKLTIGNLAPGALTFPRDTDERLALLLSRADLKSDQQVVNLSLALTKSRAAHLESTIGRWRDTLFIAAAGNEHSPVEQEGMFPAALGGTKNGNVVTVASVDGDGWLSGFSNYSSDLVDIAAPGCKIVSWLTLDRIEAVSGTSQSAPLVSFTAAALYSLWPGATPEAVKKRLAYSGLLLTRAEDRAAVRSQTRLDPFQALLIRDDIVIARNPDRLLVGDLHELKGLHCVGKPVPKWSDIRAFKRNDAARLYSNVIDAAAPCDAALDDMVAGSPNQVFMQVRAVFRAGTFQPPEKAEEQFPVADLVDFVRAELVN